jgi:hypothetical protein
MKRLISILALLPLLAAGPQQRMGHSHRYVVASGGSCSPFTDSFSGSGALNSANWTNVPALASAAPGTIVQNSGVAQASAGFKIGAAIVTGCTPSATVPYSQMVPQTNSSSGDYLGPMLLMDSSGDGYHIRINSAGVAGLYKDTAGTGTSKTWTTNTCGSVTFGSTVVRFSAVVTTTAALTLSYNGTACAAYTDSTSPWLTGYDGLYINSNSGAATATQAASFQAD